MGKLHGKQAGLTVGINKEGLAVYICPRCGTLPDEVRLLKCCHLFFCTEGHNCLDSIIGNNPNGSFCKKCGRTIDFERDVDSTDW